MTTTVSDRAFGSISEFKPSPGLGRARLPEPTPEERRAWFAQMAASEVERLERQAQGAVAEPASSLPPGFAVPSPSASRVSPARGRALAELQERVERRFPGKLELGAALGTRQAAQIPAAPVEKPDWRPELGTAAALIGQSEGSQPLVNAPPLHPLQDFSLLPAGESAGRAAPVLPPVVIPGITRDAPPPPPLHRKQRRAMLKYTQRELDRLAHRHIGRKEPERAGVWSTEDYRRIRAAVQDTTGRAAICVLYQLGSEQAVRLAEEVDTRIPRDRRRVALALAIARAPGGSLGEDVKMGFALGLFSKVMADPNNPNMERGREYRPSRRTLSSDLTWLQELGVLRRFQVPLSAVDPVEMKLNALYPTNRYFAPVTRRSQSMLQIARALGDVPPALKVSAEWTQEDAAALAELRALVERALDAGASSPEPPS